MGKDAYYFSHDSNARNDPKISALINDFGIEAYGIFWAMIEILSEQKEYKLEKFPKLYEALAKQCSSEAQAMLKLIQAMIYDYNLLVEDDKYIWSESLLRRMAEKDKRREKLSEAGKKGGNKSAAKRKNEEINQAMIKPGLSHDKATLKQVKESKVKESKVNYSLDDDDSNREPTTESKSQPETSSASSPTTDLNFAKVIQSFNQNIHPVTPIEAEKLGDWLKDLSADVILAAITEAVSNNKRSFSYINSILRNWHDQGLTTLEAIEAHKRDWQDRKPNLKMVKGDGTNGAVGIDFSKQSAESIRFNSRGLDD